LTTSTGSWGRW